MAFSMKLWWDLRTKYSIWSTLMRAKYRDPIHILAHRLSSRVTDFMLGLVCFMLWMTLNLILVFVSTLITPPFSLKI